jgi:hypothetical protein
MHYPDAFESEIDEVLAINTNKVEIRDSVNKWT